MDTTAAQSLTQRAAELADAAKTIGFMPSGVRAAVEGVAAFAQDCARLIEANAAQVAELEARAVKLGDFQQVDAARISDLETRLANEAATNAEILAKLGELQERIETLEAAAQAAQGQ